MKKLAKSTITPDAATIVAGSLKECALALSSEKSASRHWKDAAQGFSALYESREEMVSDENLKNAFFGLVSEKMGSAKALDAKLERGDKSPAALIIKAEKATARATQCTYWTRLLNYTFPPAPKAPATRESAGSDSDDDEAVATATKSSEKPVLTGFAVLQANLSLLIEALADADEAPMGVDLVGVIALLKQARAKMNGI